MCFGLFILYFECSFFFLVCLHVNSISIQQVAERNAAIEMDYGAICDVYPPFRDLASLEDFKVGKGGSR